MRAIAPPTHRCATPTSRCTAPRAAGRNRFVLFDDAMHQAAMHVLDLEQDLRRALARDEFEP